ncbi:MAG: site-specific DNA-methyltransferase [Candidimonas sp.]
MYEITNEDCFDGFAKMKDNSVDLIIADPPFGIDGANMHRHYARNESLVVDGYVEVEKSEYDEFSKKWISESARVLRPGGSIYVVAGFSSLRSILNALHETDLIEINHLVWKFNFSVYTERKWSNCHYHIAYWMKPPDNKRTFNTYCRYEEKTDSYHDRQDVIEIKRKYKSGMIRNKNQLPEELVERLVLYSSNRNDIILDPFLGGFTTAKVALKYGRNVIGFEKNKNAFDVFYPQLKEIETIDDPSPIPANEKEMKKRIKMRKTRNEKRNKYQNTASQKCDIQT